MLVLTRRIGEEIIIGGDIRLAVVAIAGKRARLGITAPPSVRVLRGELVRGHSDVTAVSMAARDEQVTMVTAQDS
jgi:carbon storage regulator